MTKFMKRYEAETGKSARGELYSGSIKLCMPTNDYIEWLEAKATAYDRVMSGGKFTMQEMANFKGRPVTVDADGAINAHGAEPHLARGGVAGFTDWWVNDANDYEEIPESFVEIPDGFDWTTSLTLPDEWEEKQC